MSGEICLIGVFGASGVAADRVRTVAGLVEGLTNLATTQGGTRA